MTRACRGAWLGMWGGLVCLFPGVSAVAQQAVVQQPSVEVLSGSTTVSVPNRGRTVIGGVSRGASSRSVYGPFPSGINNGRSFEGSSLSVGAYIHDFEELDRQALSAAESRAPHRSVLPRNDRADRAYDSLMHRDRSALRANVTEPRLGLARGAGRARSNGPDGKERGLSPDELLERGRKAEAAGKSGVALAFYRQARDRGSDAAGRELDRLGESRR